MPTAKSSPKPNPNPVARPKGGWQPGQSGNPGGRAKGIEAEARKYTLEAIQCLAKSVKYGKTWQERHSAADKLLDRGWGRPTQTIAGDGNAPLIVDFRWQGDPIVLADDETPETIEAEEAEISWQESC